MSASQDISYSINGANFTTTTGTITKGQSIRARLTRSTTSLGYAKGYVTTGRIKGIFTLRMKK